MYEGLMRSRMRAECARSPQSSLFLDSFFKKKQPVDILVSCAHDACPSVLEWALSEANVGEMDDLERAEALARQALPHQFSLNTALTECLYRA